MSDSYPKVDHTPWGRFRDRLAHGVANFMFKRVATRWYRDMVWGSILLGMETARNDRIPDEEREAVERLENWLFSSNGVIPLTVPSDMHTIIAPLRARPASPVTREALTEFMHSRNRFDYDECQHGTYMGGPSNGEPYAMCERQGAALFEFLSARVSAEVDDEHLRFLCHTVGFNDSGELDGDVLAAAILADGYRRLSPVTREALLNVAYGELSDMEVPGSAAMFMRASAITDAILSRFSLPEPAEVKPFRLTVPDLEMESADYWRGVADAEAEITAEYGIPVSPESEGKNNE